jgi:ABC-type glutathione transport system ATPase component
MTEPLLAVEGLRVAFVLGRDPLGRPRRTLQALKGVSLSVAAGECVGVIGESGSGKSTLGACIVGLQRPDAGEIRLNAPAQIVFQDPNESLDPHLPLWETVAEGLEIGGLRSRQARRAAAAEGLAAVGLAADLMDRRPHALSGGQRQRVAIARALATGARLIVLDEPTSALDTSVQEQVLDLLLGIQQRTGVAYLLITHDMAVAAHMCHRLVVMKAGAVIETGETEALLANPQTDYARSLIAATPRLGE